MVISVVMEKSKCLSVLGSGRIITGLLVSVLLLGLSPNAAAQSNFLAEAKQALENADAFMGDWEGSWTLEDGYESGPLVAQVIALGKNEYRANFHREFDYEWPPLFFLNGQLDSGAVRFEGRAEYDGNVLDIQSLIRAGKFSGKFKGQADGQAISGTLAMEKAIRLSRTLGAKPPAAAIVLFDGKNLDQWQHAQKRPGIDKVQWLIKDGAVAVTPGSGGGIISKQEFTDIKLHLEFCTPFMPAARGQGRANSGVYLQGRYEVQILDSYGLEGRDNECGGIYSVGRPRVNMCAPPTQWQTYDISFRAPRFNDNDEKIRGALLTVLHNGVEIQYKAEAKGPTTAAPDRTETGPGGVYLQDHGNPVQYRNIWLVELAPTDP
jgi:hypothetical protein